MNLRGDWESSVVVWLSISVCQWIVRPVFLSAVCRWGAVLRIQAVDSQPGRSVGVASGWAGWPECPCPCHAALKLSRPWLCLSRFSRLLLVVGDWVQGWHSPILMRCVRKEGPITCQGRWNQGVQESSFQRGVFKRLRAPSFLKDLSQVSKDSLFEMALD